MKKKVIFTIDVEGHVGNEPIDRLIYGVTNDGECCGIDKIMDLLDVYKIRGLFFVDIAEAWHYGEKKVANVLSHIKDRGHDVGVHIHPDHMADRSKLFLSDYTYEQQYTIIKKCTDFYCNVLNETPVAFRAGKYGANSDTLRILEQLGYKTDFSQFYGQKWCHIQPPITKTHVKCTVNNLIEIPVTIYKSFSSVLYSRYDKLDASTPILEFKTVINQIIKNNSYDIIVLFAHSFSFLKWRRTPNNPRYSNKLYRKLEKQLKFIQNTESLQMISLKEVVEMDEINNITGSDRIERLSGFYSWYALFDKCIKVFKSRIELKFRKL